MASKITEEIVEDERKYRVVDISFIDFKLKFVDDDFVLTFLLEFDEVAELSSPVDVTKGWIRATTKRPIQEIKDYIYVHPKCPKQLRSFKAVKEFINREYDLVPSDVPGKDLENNPGLQLYRLLDNFELYKEEKKKNRKKVEQA